VAYAMITGKGDLQAGNIENTGDASVHKVGRHQARSRSDIPWYMAIGGAGVTTMGNFMSAL